MTIPPWLLWLALGLLALLLILLAGAWVISWLSIHPHRRRPRGTPVDFGAAFEEVCFPSKDGTKLSGWLVPCGEARGVVVLCHGMSAERSQMLPWAEWLWNAGFTLLLFDFRALGSSGGTLCTMGLEEPDDIFGAVDFLCSREDVGRLPVGVFGFSMGGVAALIAAAKDRRIQAVVSHGAYATLNGAIRQRCRRHFGPFSPPVEAVARRMGSRWFPGDPADVSPLSAMPRIAPRPVLLLNGARDPIVLAEDTALLAEAYGAPDSHVVLPRSRHDYPHPADEARYRSLVMDFFERHLARIPGNSTEEFTPVQENTARKRG